MTPLANGVHAHTDALGDPGVGPLRGSQQHDPRPHRQLLSRGPSSDQVPQPLPLNGVQLDPVRAGQRQGRNPSHRGVSSVPPASPATPRSWLLTRRSATMTLMAAPPASTKTSLQQRLSAHARAQWPQLARVTVRFRGAFAYVDGQLPDGDTVPLMRLRYGGSAARWGFAMYLASKDGYQDAVLPTGAFAGLPEDALDCAAGLYLGDPTS